MTESTTTTPTDSTWRNDAACLTADPELFFAEPADVESSLKAKAICDNCRVADNCLAFATRTRQRFGIWGGTSATARRNAAGGAANGCRQCNTDIPSGYRFCADCSTARRDQQQRESARRRSGAFAA